MNVENEQKMLHLEIIKGLRPKMSQLEHLKAKILCEAEMFTKEVGAVDESQRELEILKLEKKMHEEAITALDDDINHLSKSMTQSKHEQEVIKTRAVELVNEFNPLKREVDEVRATIGLELLPDVTEANVFFKKT